jgi:hypothetical protein
MTMKHVLRPVVFLAVALCSCATSGVMRPPQDPEEYVRTLPIVQVLLEEAGEWNDFLNIPVQSHRLSSVHLIILEKPIWTDESIHPISGTWIVRYSLAGAPEYLWYNVGFKAVEGEVPRRITMTMGESLATRALFDAAIRTVLAATRMKLEEDGEDVQIEAKGPLKPVVAYTYLIQPPELDAEGNLIGTWREKWIVRMNRTDTEVWLDFRPDGAGGTDIVVTTESYGRVDQPRQTLPEAYNLASA